MREETVNGIRIFDYDVTDSTNQRAKEYAKENGAHFPAVFIAEEQTAGRGRRGRSFDSAKGAGLYISFLFRTDGELDASRITMGAAVKLLRVIYALSGVKARIKWVNDIFVGSRKLAGILTEGELGSFGYAVCGIGINLYERDFPAEISEIVTTLEREAHRKVDKELFKSRLIEEFFNPESMEDMLSDYRRHSLVLGKRVEVRKILGEVYNATAIEIADDGALIVEREDGTREHLISAEVSIKAKG